MPLAGNHTFFKRWTRAPRLGACALSFLTTVLTAACHQQPQVTRGQAKPAATPAQMAHWDPGNQRFVSAPAAPAAPVAPPQLPPDAGPITLQRLPSGKGTFIDLRGGFQSYLTMHVRDGGASVTECRGEGGRP